MMLKLKKTEFESLSPYVGAIDENGRESSISRRDAVVKVKAGEATVFDDVIVFNKKDFGAKEWEKLESMFNLSDCQSFGVVTKRVSRRDQ